MSWKDDFDPELIKRVQEVDEEIAPKLAAIDDQIMENQAKSSRRSVITMSPRRTCQGPRVTAKTTRVAIS